MRRRSLLQTSGGGGIDPTKSSPADICFYDKNADKLIIVKGDEWDSATYPLSNYTPIGIVVVPGSHDVYGTGQCGVMSLVEMNCSTPTTGSTSYQSMYWGVYGTDISTLTNFNVVCHGGSNGSSLTGTNSSAYLPSDNFSGTQCPHDTTAYWNQSDYRAPSPYLTDGSRNSMYYQTASPSSSSNALSDFNGITNTSKIVTQRGTKDYSSWKPTYNTEADYPAASCCDMFYTNGTKQGDWYLPACGELGYMISRLKAINEAISKITTAYGSSYGVSVDTNSRYWSSSEYSSHFARRVYTGNGYVGYGGKNLSYYVRAFLRV